MDLAKALKLVSGRISDGAKGAETIRLIPRNLAALTQYIWLSFAAFMAQAMVGMEAIGVWKLAMPGWPLGPRRRVTNTESPT
jgi:hypothetical protein